MPEPSTRVVIVDDVADIRRLVRTALRFRSGIEVVAEAADGRAGVEAVTLTQPDVVIMDVGLPGLAGRALLSELRRACPQSKVIVFTGTDLADDAGLRGRVDGYVLKDADLDYLVNLVENLGREAAESASLELDRHPRSAQLARRFVRERCEQWDVRGLLDNALLIASELVTNAVTHAHSGCLVRLLLREAALRIEVFDEGRGTPDPTLSSSSDEHGRGLILVSAMSSAWGVQAIPDDGKVVWAEVPLAPTG